MMLPQPKCVVMATHRRKNWSRVRQDDATESGSDSTEWPDAAEESHAALLEVMTPVAWEFLNKVRNESGWNAGC